MPDTRPLRVFLCHASQDKPAVREIYRRLKSEAWIDPWLDEEKLLPGQDWELEIDTAVRNADVVIVCLSTASVSKKGYVQKEIKMALDVADQMPDGQIYIIPLRLDECEVPNRLNKWQWLDYFGERLAAYNLLLSALKLNILPDSRKLDTPSRIKKLEGELSRLRMELALAYDMTVQSWGRALDIRGRETEGHTFRVTELTVKLATVCGLSQEQLLDIRKGAMLHDVGKISIPDNVFGKPGPLSEDEWKILCMHPQYAYDLLYPIQYLRSALDIPYCHHERWDGTGYPRGLKGKEIPLAARIFSIVDVWDALISGRPYRKAWSKEEAIEFNMQNAAKVFDPDIVKMFLQVI